jgi:hypothetical protein
MSTMICTRVPFSAPWLSWCSQTPDESARMGFHSTHPGPTDEEVGGSKNPSPGLTV